MKVQVFISESRISKKKYVEDFKPKERLEYLSKYPKSSFKKFTDAKGNVSDKPQEKPAKRKPKLSGKPKTPKNVAAPKRGRNPLTKKFTREMLADATPRQANSIKKAVAAINEGRGNKRTLATLKRNVPEDMHDKIDAAFNKSQAKAKAAVETRRKEISEPKKKAPAKKAPAKKPAKKKTATKSAPKQEAPAVEKPSTQDAAKVVQKIPKAQRGSFMESMKRVFARKATEKDVEKIERAKKGMDKTSRESLDKLKRYAEAGVVGKKKPKQEERKYNNRKKLTRRQIMERIKNVDMVKIAEYREKEAALKSEFKDKADAILKGSGTKEQRMKKYTKLRDSYVGKLERNAKSANTLLKKTREKIVKLRDEKDRRDG